MRAAIRYFATMSAAIVLGLVLLTGAMAHAGLVSTDPVDGSVLPALPAEVVLEFTEPVTPLAFGLIAPDGTRLQLEGATAADSRLDLPLPAQTARGTYLVSWRVVSADGHPVSGALALSLGAPSSGGSAPATDSTLAVAIWLVRAALYVALFVGVGLAAFALTVGALPGRLRPVARFACIGGLLLAPLALGLHGLDALGLGFGQSLKGAPWVAALGTSYGATIGAAMFALLAAYLALRCAAGPTRTLFTLLAWAAAALAPVLSGHAGTAPPTWVSRPAVVLHIAGLIFWVGALLPLMVLMNASGPEAVPALRRFSRSIPVALVPVLGGGLALAALQMGLPGPAWLGPYGLLLGAKLLLVALLLALALWNRTRLTAPALGGDTNARRRLRRSIAIELALVVAILAVVAGWRFTPPARVVAELSARPAQLHLHTDAAMADISVTPGRAGSTEMKLWLMDGDLAPLTPRAVGVAISRPDLGVERLKRDATLGEDGFWHVPLTFPVAGPWTIALDLRIDDFTLAKLSGTLEIAP